jgi:hypothetical protein
LVGAVLIAALVGGCAATKPNQELESVAKDWSRLIRASQVIPVYPLTEDLRPGDVFVVETPLQQQAEEYNRVGYLRLEQAMARLGNLPYRAFYGESFGGLADGLWPPDHWGRRAEQATTQGDSWGVAPRAAFPTYSFSIKKGRGANIGIPVKGVPVGLSLMQTASASGSITIADAYTYGLPLEVLQGALEEWYGQASNRSTIVGIRAHAGRDIYLRVIARVYLTRNLIVSMNNTDVRGAKLAAGNTTTTSPLTVDTVVTESYSNALDRLNSSLSTSSTGGSVTMLHASNRSVSMSETFARPLTIGYISFDFPIDSDGRLKSPIATVANVGGSTRPPATLGTSTMAAAQLRMWRWYVGQESDAVRGRVYRAAAQSSDREFQKRFSEATVGNSAEAFDSVVRAYLFGKSPLELYQDRVRMALQSAMEKEGLK